MIKVFTTKKSKVITVDDVKVNNKGVNITKLYGKDLVDVYSSILADETSIKNGDYLLTKTQALRAIKRAEQL